MEKNETKQTKTQVFNVIILDKSGSMECIRKAAIDGFNETLNGIRNTAIEQKEQNQFVSIYCFDTTNSRYLFQNEPIEKIKNLTSKDYRPNACTPLYDAIGYTVSQLKEIATDSNAIGKVIIITDGYENASKSWNHSSIVELIERLKKKGWLFTFMGANIDVEQTSRSLGIDSYIEFLQTEDSMKEMFECERRSQRAYFKKMSYLRRNQLFSDASEEYREHLLSLMNDNYFTECERVAPNFVSDLKPNEIFVFGSNINGQHCSGASGYAKTSFGAIMGKAELQWPCLPCLFLHKR